MNDFGFMSKFISSFKKNETVFTANNVYLNTRYGRIETEEERLKKLYNRINSLIESKSIQGEFCCAIDVPKELAAKSTNDIIEYYKNKGFTVVNMKDVIEGIDKTFLFITWANKY